MPLRRLILIPILPILTLVVAAGGFVPRTSSVLPPTRPLRECPEGGRWTRVFRGKDSVSAVLAPSFVSLPNGEIPLSGVTTDIVEFHDCQRFIVQENRSQPLHYSSLFAIFARLRLDRAYVPPRRIRTRPNRPDGRSNGGPSRTSTRAVFDPVTMGTPMATILAVEDGYDQLGIQRAFNCLYFFRTSTSDPDAWEARVVPVGINADACTVPLERGDQRGTTLTVSVMTNARDGINIPPPVARWDWDPNSHLQYIGIRCGSAWCEVHPKAPGSTFSSSTPLPPLARKAKGWYDEQILAVAHKAKGMPEEVSTITGTIMPYQQRDAEFGPPETSLFNGRWRKVAYVAIRGDPGFYVSKLNLVETGNTVTKNVVSMCFIGEGAPNTCVPTSESIAGCAEREGWFARVAHPGVDGAEVAKYFCVTRTAHDHLGVLPAPPVLPVPNAPRWRWAIDDETMWIACMSGCCEVKAR